MSNEFRFVVRSLSKSSRFITCIYLILLLLEVRIYVNGICALRKSNFFTPPPPHLFFRCWQINLSCLFQHVSAWKKNIYKSRKLFKESGHSKDRNVQQIFFLVYEHCSTFWNKNPWIWHVKIQVEFANYLAVLSTQVTI